eukprot:TRINITY_DN97255_c0_g1_i1.p1 TRINITY_DN97255_c0_g1~~TRINITY_DN97255_c0_g1_i1.p1  ORF type:complete len:196 (+),score=4.47 TRINITY_DN97255_c0_g1_i1:81-668(+)
MFQPYLNLIALACLLSKSVLASHGGGLKRQIEVSSDAEIPPVGPPPIHDNVLNDMQTHRNLMMRSVGKDDSSRRLETATPPDCEAEFDNQECCIKHRGHDGCAKGKDHNCGGCHRVHRDGKYQTGKSGASCGRSQDCEPITTAPGDQSYHSVCIHGRCYDGTEGEKCGRGHDCLNKMCGGKKGWFDTGHCVATTR